MNEIFSVPFSIEKTTRKFQKEEMNSNRESHIVFCVDF